MTVRFADCFSISDEYEDSVDLCILASRIERP